MADRLAINGVVEPYVGSELTCGISMSTINKELKNWKNDRNMSHKNDIRILETGKNTHWIDN